MTRNARVRTIDLETTDFPPEGRVLEAGYYDTLISTEDGEGSEATWQVDTIIDRGNRSYFDPSCKSSLSALSTHHIPDDIVIGQPPHTECSAWLQNDAGRRADIFVAHNYDFEKEFVTLEDGQWWICTYRVALRLFPDFEKHNNQYLRYALGLELDSNLAMPPHRAHPDAYTTAHVFAEMLKRASIRDMIKWTLDLPYLTKVDFGEHFGKRYDELPISYLRWMLGKDFDPPKAAAARRALESLTSSNR